MRFVAVFWKNNIWKVYLPKTLAYCRANCLRDTCPVLRGWLHTDPSKFDSVRNVMNWAKIMESLEHNWATISKTIQFFLWCDTLGLYWFISIVNSGDMFYCHLGACTHCRRHPMMEPQYIFKYIGKEQSTLLTNYLSRYGAAQSIFSRCNAPNLSLFKVAIWLYLELSLDINSGHQTLCAMWHEGFEIIKIYST